MAEDGKTDGRRNRKDGQRQTNISLPLAGDKNMMMMMMM